jgi:hypothetical protein
MPRDLTPAQVAILQSPIKRIATFVTIGTTPETNAWNGVGSVTAGGKTYLGIGELGSVSGLGGERNASAQNIQITLSGIPGLAMPSGIVAKTRSSGFQGAKVVVSISFTDVNTDQLLMDPQPVWTGFVDSMSFQVGDPYICTLTAENYSSRLRRINSNRMTTVSHNQRLGNPATRDGFFDFNVRLNAQPKSLS